MHDGDHRKLSNKGKNKNKPEQDRKVDYSKYNNPDSTITVSKEEAKRAQIIGGALIAIIILLVAVIWGSVAFVQNKNAQKAEETKVSSQQTMEKAAKPAGYVTDDGAIQWTQDGIVKGELPDKWKNTPKVDVYMDPICPGCGSVDRVFNPYYEQYLKNGEIVLRIHPITFLTDYSSDDYSGRAANAILRSLDADPSKTYDYITYLMSDGIEPEEGPNYEPVSDADLKKHAEDVGYTKAQVKDLTDQKYNEWLRAMTDYTINRAELQRSDGQFATPVVTFNGEKLNYDNGVKKMLEEFIQKVDAANKK